MQAVIKDITKRMGAGMAEFVSKDLGQGTITLKEYDLYCHYVAGLVGEGLTRMFSESGLEEKQVRESIYLPTYLNRVKLSAARVQRLIWCIFIL